MMTRQFDPGQQQEVKKRDGEQHGNSQCQIGKIRSGGIKANGQVDEKNDQGDEVAKVVQLGSQCGEAEGQAGDLTVAAVEDRDELEQQPGGQGIAVAAAANQPAAEQPQRQVGHGDMVRPHPQADEEAAHGPGELSIQVPREKPVAGLEHGKAQQAPRFLLALAGIHLDPAVARHHQRRNGRQDGVDDPVAPAVSDLGLQALERSRLA